jgi:ABC-type siderophore export system fused ATPase/permease subunit
LDFAHYARTAREIPLLGSMLDKCMISYELFKLFSLLLVLKDAEENSEFIVGDADGLLLLLFMLLAIARSVHLNCLSWDIKYKLRRGWSKYIFISCVFYIEKLGKGDLIVFSV